MAHGILQWFLEHEKTKPNAVFLKQPLGGVYRTWTFSEAGREVRSIAAGFDRLGLEKGSHIAILSKNCAHWLMADLAIMYSGYISIPIYPTLTAASIQPILEHSGAKAIFVGKLDDYKNQKNGIPEGVHRLGIDLFDTAGDSSWESWVEAGSDGKEPNCWALDDVFTIMYTSGTTGKPKGVMHTVQAFDATITAAIRDLKINTGIDHRMFSYLPLSHIAERIGIESLGIKLGACFSFAETLESFAQNLADTQPTVFFAVPRIWSKFREKIEQKLPPSRLNLLLSIPVINNVIRKSIRKKLGLTHAELIFSGAAPIPVEMLQWYDKLGIRVLQAYGMTEDCVYAHFNRNDNNRHGTVGQPLKGLDVRISDEGEIRVKCPGLTKGYYKEPELTAELFDANGYLRTGDKGSIDKDGFLTITGRVKDQFKTDKGKYISPAPIEMALATNPDIESVCVVGMGVPQPLAMVVLSAAGKAKTNKEVEASLIHTLVETNKNLEAHEVLEKAVVLKEDWTVDNGLLTPTLKVKRNELEAIYLGKYPEWYGHPEKIVWE
jgi:long-chain acyl-CoA synthetase